jgi:hypothetical protein
MVQISISQPNVMGKQRTGNIKPKKGNDKISFKNQKKTTGGARTPSDRSARDSVQAHG